MDRLIAERAYGWIADAGEPAETCKAITRRMKERKKRLGFKKLIQTSRWLKTPRCCVSAFSQLSRCGAFQAHIWPAYYIRPMHVVIKTLLSNRNYVYKHTSGLFWSPTRLGLWLCLCGRETVGVTPGHAEVACLCVCVCGKAGLACAGAVCWSLFSCSGMCARRGRSQCCTPLSHEENRKP